jgi:hypothetical protein
MIESKNTLSSRKNKRLLPKRRHRDVHGKTLLVIAAVCLLAGITALGFLRTSSRED